MLMKKYAIYVRVSTQKQGRSGLGLEAQKQMCLTFIKNNNGQHVETFTDVESGTHRNRRGLWEAIDYCKRENVALVIAKLDRLARDVEFTFRVINTGIEINFCDMPMVNTMILGVFASVAQYERELVSSRTKAALAVKKDNGIKLGAASERYTLTDEGKERKAMCGQTKRQRFLQNRDTLALIKILKQVFPKCRETDETSWQKTFVDTKIENRTKVYQLMKDYQEIDSTLFEIWNLDEHEPQSVTWQRKLSSKMNALINSLTNN